MSANANALNGSASFFGPLMNVFSGKPANNKAVANVVKTNNAAIVNAVKTNNAAVLNAVNTSDEERGQGKQCGS